MRIPSVVFVGRHRPGLVAAALGAAVLSLAPLHAAQAQASAPQAGAKSAANGTPNSKSVAKADVDFMHKAAAGSAAEIALGKLAASKSAAADVKSYGAQMVEDHGKASDELKQLASAKSVTLPEAPDATHRALMEKIGKLEGKAFDAAFKKQMVDDHQKTVADFQKASKSASDADLKAWAQKTLPTLEHHLKMAQGLPA